MHVVQCTAPTIQLGERPKLPAVDDDDNVLGATGRGDVPRPQAGVVVVVETREIGVPLPARVEPDQPRRWPEVLPSKHKQWFRCLCYKKVCDMDMYGSCYVLTWHELHFIKLLHWNSQE